MNKPRTILHPTDFSDSARYAFRLARMLARQQGARLVILHVKPTLGTMVSYDAPLTSWESEENHDRLLKMLHHLRVPDASVHVEHWIVDGEGASDIIRVANEVGADLIVMGTHDRSGFNRLVMGSVAEQVLRQARCPVVTVKMPRHAGHAIPAPDAEPVTAAM